MENNEYLNSTKRIFQGLQFFGIFPFLSFHNGTQTGIRLSRLFVGFCLFYYSVTITNEIKLMNRTVSMMLTKPFDFNFLVRLIPTTYARSFYLLIPFLTWRKSKDVHVFQNKWKNYQNELENLTRTPYTSPVKKKIQRTAFFLTLFTLVSTSSTKTDYTYYFLTIHTHIPSVTNQMVMFQLIFILWWANCKYVECEAKYIIKLVQKSLRNRSQRNLQQLIHLWNHLCDLNDKFNVSNSGLFVFYISICVVDVITLTYYSLYLYFIQGNTVTGVTYMLPGIFCMANIALLYDAANSALKQITSKMTQIVLDNDTIDINEEKLRSILYFLEVVEVRDPEIDLNGFLSLDRARIISVYAIIVNYLIVLKQFATT